MPGLVTPASRPARAARSRPSSGSALGLAALAAWMVSAVAGTWLLAAWLARAAPRRRGTRQRTAIPRLQTAQLRCFVPHQSLSAH